MAPKKNGTDQRKPNRRALLSTTGGRDEAELSFNAKSLDLRLPATREILNDDTLKNEENSLRVEIFPRTSQRKKKNKSGSKNDTGYDVAILKSIVQQTLPETNSQIYEKQDQNEKAVKKDWHEIPERVLTPEEERDVRVVENRAFLDPKRFYKSSGTGRKQGELPTRVHFGTVIAGAHEFYSARLTRKERKPRIIDEVLADRHVVDYAKHRSNALLNAARTSRRVVDRVIRKRRSLR